MNKKFIISQLLLIPYILTAASSSSPSLALSKLLFFQPSSTSLLKPQETHREFAMTNFPSEDPCIIVGCKTNNNNEPTAIKTAVAIREFVAGSLILHARSGNHANLELVHKLFLQSFTDSQLLQARISKPGSIIHEQVESFSKKHNIKLLAELAQNKESKEKAFELAKNVSEKDDFVKCKLFWFSCGPTGDRLNLFQFGFPYKDRYNDEDYPVCGVQKIRMKFFPAIVHTLGLSKSKRTKLKEKKQQKQLAHTLDKYKLALAAHQFTNEIEKDDIDPKFAQTSFVFYDLDKLIKAITEKYQSLLSLEESFSTISRQKKLEEALNSGDMSRLLTRDDNYPEWYKGANEKGDTPLSMHDIEGILIDGTKELCDWCKKQKTEKSEQETVEKSE